MLTGCLEPTPSPPLQQSVYVWQRDWTSAVHDAVAVIPPDVSSVMVLVGELHMVGQSFAIDAASVAWNVFDTTHAQVIPVLRATISLDAALANGQVTDAVALIASFVNTLHADASAAGVMLEGLQLDYDCPTAKLGRYAELLRKLRAALPGTKLTITGLPTWLNSAELRAVLQSVESWVLQVHSFERPHHIGEDLRICRDDLVAEYVGQAARLGFSFYVALPTYGYEVVFDETGDFVTLAAEGGNRQWPPSYSVRHVRSSPQAMARLVSEWQDERPPSMRGIAWFRMPVASDRLNWSWPMLVDVMQGTPATPELVAEVRHPDSGLAEIWIRNGIAGSQITIALPGALSAALAYDTFGGFTRDSDNGRGPALIGSLAMNIDEMLVAWFRLHGKYDGPTTMLEVQCVY